MDGIVTHDEVVQWLRDSVRIELQMALPPELRGWYTREEAERDGGRFVEVRTLSEPEPRLLRIGD